MNEKNHNVLSTLYMFPDQNIKHSLTIRHAVLRLMHLFVAQQNEKLEKKRHEDT